MEERSVSAICLLVPIMYQLCEQLCEQLCSNYVAKLKTIIDDRNARNVVTRT